MIDFFFTATLLLYLTGVWFGKGERSREGINLLAGLWKRHPRKRRGKSFCVHLATSPLQIVILPGLSVGRLKTDLTLTTVTLQTTKLNPTLSNLEDL